MSPQAIRARRLAAQLTQAEAAELVCSTVHAWRKWETPAGEKNHRPMHPGLWDLFLIRTERTIRDIEKLTPKKTADPR